ncbi:hypothetical protein BGZ96_007878 [Linnemannia gamsii]|uniref:SCP domain-containing protein n=1 Tax=Linnemannia gamsii TaxID=64522 RepID=A0ABQ7JZF1_9FUNG|nr:hypothetical protein BGZ96_007878 [Linnemannia gamsii]
MLANDILARARLAALLLVAGSALVLSSPTSADEVALANAVDFQAPAENNASLPPTVAADAPVVGPGTTPLTNAQIKEILDEHNKYRDRHGSPQLEWDESLVQDAERALVNCKPFSSPSRRGRNEFTSVETDFFLAVEIWYDQIIGYDFQDPSKSTRNSGTFSQLVWSSSTRIGCAVKECPSLEEGEDVGGKSTFVHLCEYDPLGNTVTRSYSLYKKNVLPAKTA